ncbi:MAG TPA: hypothetical protein VF457_19000 [Burkholderiaceae bacterium]
MNTRAPRHPHAADPGGTPTADAPMQVVPLAEGPTPEVGAEEDEGRYRGELFLPGWLPIERDPSAERGPKG